MAQLQLYITESHHGYSGLLSINPTAAVQAHIRDLRSDLASVDFNQDMVNIMYMVRQIPEGLLFTILRTMPGRGTDHRAANILFPDGLVMSIQERDIMLKIAFEALMLEDFTADGTAHVRSALAHDFKVRHNSPRRISNHGKTPACIYFGPGRPSLVAYLDSPLYQPVFARYSGILLLDVAAGQHSVLPDLTRKAIVPLIALNPPAPTPEGFKPYIFQEVFDAPFLVSAGESVNVAWRCSGFETLEVSLVPEGPDTPVPVPDTSQARKLISPNSFNIAIEGANKGTTQYTIIVNGQKIESPTPFTYAELTHADVEVASVGFFTFRGTMNLARTAKAMISLKAKGHTYRFDLPLDTPEPMESIRIYLRTKRPLEKSPIEGYSIVGGKVNEGPGHANNLYYTSGRARALTLTALVALLIGIIGGYIIAWFYPPVFERTKTSEEVPQVEAPAKPVRTMATMVDGPVPPPPRQEDSMPLPVLRPVFAPMEETEPEIEPVDLFVPETSITGPAQAASRADSASISR